MITFAGKDMVPALKELWEECFHDGESFISFYFNKRFQAEQVLVWLDDDGIPRGMLSMLPASTYDGGIEYPLYYIYAVATSHRFRGRGISSLLLSHAQRAAENEGAGLFLIPATPSLFDFYGKRGFSNQFFISTKEYSISRDLGVQEVSFAPVTAKAYWEFRNQYLPKQACVHWSQDAIAYSLAEGTLFGGFAYQITAKDGTSGALIGYQQEDVLLIREILLAEEWRQAAADVLADKYRCSSVKMRLPPWEGRQEDKSVFAMGYNLPWLQDGYLNLALE